MPPLLFYRLRGIPGLRLLKVLKRMWEGFSQFDFWEKKRAVFADGPFHQQKGSFAGFASWIYFYRPQYKAGIPHCYIVLQNLKTIVATCESFTINAGINDLGLGFRQKKRAVSQTALFTNRREVSQASLHEESFIRNLLLRESQSCLSATFCSKREKLQLQRVNVTYL